MWILGLPFSFESVRPSEVAFHVLIHLLVFVILHRVFAMSSRNAFFVGLITVNIALSWTFASPLNGRSSQSCTPLTAHEINSMGNNSLFTRWRPTSHFIAPAGWMNDPCGAMYDPTRDTYNLFYQWHPQHINWGNISWGYATSKDLITWTDHVGWKDEEALALGPTGFGKFPEHYNGLGIFSGTAQPVNLKGEQDGTLLLMYTSVSWLPTNWEIPYHPHTESQSLAMSTDGGKTWKEYEGNPVIHATTGTAPSMYLLRQQAL